MMIILLCLYKRILNTNFYIGYSILLLYSI
nr:MAG TPA: hypothetical protein [Bacteriophage sp.]